MSAKQAQPRGLAFPAVGVAFVYFAICLLTFGGTFHSSADEWFMYAQTESVGRWQVTNIDQVFWVGEYMGWARFGLDGHLYVPYTNFSFAQPLAGLPAFFLATLLPGVGLAQVTLLTNAVVVALTLAVLVLLLGELGFSRPTALVTAALFGLGSSLWPYAKTYFGEPLLGLSFLLCIYFAVRYRHALAGHSQGTAIAPVLNRWLWLTSAGLALTVLAKPTGALMAPFLLAFLVMSARQASPLARMRISLAFGALPALVVAGILALTWLRFGGAAGLQPPRGFHTPLLTGLWGLLLSPGRSLFLYSPVALLALPGTYFLFKRARLLTTVVGLFVCSYVALIALWDGWHAGFTAWGPRYLVPLLPLMALPVAALLAGQGHRRLIAGVTALVAVAGIAVQALAVGTYYTSALEELGRRYPGLHYEDPRALVAAFGDAASAPILLVWQQLSTVNGDIAIFDRERGLDLPALLVCAAVLALATAYLAMTLRAGRGWLRPLGATVLACAAVAAIAFVMPRFAASPRFISDEYRGALGLFYQQAPPDAALVTSDLAANYYFNYPPGPQRRYGLSVYETDSLPPVVSQEVDRIAAAHGEVWILGPTDRASFVETALTRLLPVVDEWQYGGLRLLRARRADQPPPAAGVPLGARFGDAVELLAADPVGALSAGECLHVDLYWRRLGPVGDRYSVSLQLVEPGGRLVAQQDGPPGAANRVAPGWGNGASTLDPRVLSLPPGLASGEYSLLVVVYDWASGERLLLPDGKNAAQVAILGLK